jgi:hypothetical protein
MPTENLAESEALRPSAEMIRAHIRRGSVTEHLQNAERGEQRMREAFARIDSDENLSVEGKRAAAQQVIERHADVVVRNYRTAREKLEASIKSQYNFSLPFVDGKTFASGAAKIQDTTEMLAVQTEADSIAKRVSGRPLQELTKAVSKNPNDKGIQEADSTVQRLRQEFDAAMELGGVEGRVRALAVARVCEQMGMPLDYIVDHHRTQIHCDALTTAQNREAALLTIPDKRSFANLKRNPYEGASAPLSAGRIGTYSSAGKPLMRPKAGGMLFPAKQRRRAW